MKVGRFSYSMMNTKMGLMPSFSVQPIVTCGANCKFCRYYCYGLQGNFNLPSVKKSLKNNTDILMDMDSKGDFSEFVEDVSAFIRLYGVKYFRIHVAGDLFSIGYADNWKMIAERNPDTKFWGFTKQFDILRDAGFCDVPNMNFMMSAWPGLEIPSDLREKYSVAWIQDSNGIETRIPEGAKICDGGCSSCTHCIGNNGDTVLFLHGRYKTIKEVEDEEKTA